MPLICSGLINSGVPRTIPVAVSFAISGSARRSLASPKSITHGPDSSWRMGIGHQHNVFRLQIPVDDVHIMGMLEPAAHLEHERNAEIEWERTVAHLAIAQQLTGR